LDSQCEDVKMGFNFPNAPADGTVFAPAGGPTYTFSNGVWKMAGGGSGFVVVSDTAPPTPFPGQLWWESDTGALFFWYVDANSSQWVQINFTPSNSGISSIVQTVITSSGTYVKPASLKFLRVEGVGPGGGGAQAVTAAANQNAVASGAGAGGYGYRLFAASELAASTPYTIGAAGTGGAVATGGTGGTSEFGSGINCTLGGGGGATRSASSAVVLSISGGNGGNSGSGWTISVTGEAGHTSVAALSPPISLRGRGGVTRFGWSPVEDGYFGNAGGPAPSGYGGGAGGQVTFNSAAGSSAPAGGPAMFLFTEYF
jgi:hypothetical protein